MRRLILLAVLVLTACAPRISTDLKTRLNKVLEDGATLTAMTEQGVAFDDYSAQLAKTKGSYSLAITNWPADLLPTVRVEFDEAFKGWELAHEIWSGSMNGGGRPEAPNQLYYDDLVSFAGEENLNIHVAPYRTYIDLDDALGALFGISSAHFNAAQALVLTEIQ